MADRIDETRARMDREIAAQAAAEELPPVEAYAGEEPTAFTDTDIANARRFAHQHLENVRFTPERGWYVWDGRRWAHDEKLIRIQEL